MQQGSLSSSSVHGAASWSGKILHRASVNEAQSAHDTESRSAHMQAARFNGEDITISKTVARTVNKPSAGWLMTRRQTFACGRHIKQGGKRLRWDDGFFTDGSRCHISSSTETRQCKTPHETPGSGSVESRSARDGRPDCCTLIQRSYGGVEQKIFSPPEAQRDACKEAKGTAVKERADQRDNRRRDSK